MSEIEQLKERIDKSGIDGVPTAHIRDDYEPIGAQMIRDLTATDQYITARVEKACLKLNGAILQRNGRIQ